MQRSPAIDRAACEARSEAVGITGIIVRAEVEDHDLVLRLQGAGEDVHALAARAALQRVDGQVHAGKLLAQVGLGPDLQAVADDEDGTRVLSARG